MADAECAGQMAGSLTAGAVHLMLRRYGGAAAPALHSAPLLAAAALLEVAGRFAARLRPMQAGLAQNVGKAAGGTELHSGKASPLLV